MQNNRTHEKRKREREGVLGGGWGREGGGVGGGGRESRWQKWQGKIDEINLGWKDLNLTR